MTEEVFCFRDSVIETAKRISFEEYCVGQGHQSGRMSIRNNALWEPFERFKDLSMLFRKMSDTELHNLIMICREYHPKGESDV